MVGLTAKEVAKILDCTVAWVYQLRAKGELKLDENNLFIIETVMEYKNKPKNKGGRPYKEV